MAAEFGSNSRSIWSGIRGAIANKSKLTPDPGSLTPWEVENVGGDAGIATGSSDGEIVRAPGALGGEPTPNSRSFLIRDGKQDKIRGHRLYDLKPGDVLLKISGGGAGVDLPEEREPEKV